MNTTQFEQVVNEQLALCTSILIDKAKEYANGGDRLHNFKIAASIQGLTPRQALVGMMAKHTVSVYDMCMAGTYSKEKWEEKITDHMNYLLLLKAVLTEEEWPSTLVYAGGKVVDVKPIGPEKS